MTSGSRPARQVVSFNGRPVGDGQAVYVIAEIGINHNGSLDIAKQLIDGAVSAHADCVKFQKRTPELCTPRDQWDVERDTPWGRMTYIEYRRRIEFGQAEYAEIDRYCREHHIQWTASAWDEPSVDFLAGFKVPFIKAASASLTDVPLLTHMRKTGIPIMISTGMSSMDEIDAGVKVLGREKLLVAHATSTYPCPPKELNLRMITTLRDRFPECPIGYSGHETGLAPTHAAVALGASFLERHITIDRAMWGSDQAASVEIGGLQRLIRDVRDIEEAMGDGVKQVYASEANARKRLRRVPSGPGA